MKCGNWFVAALLLLSCFVALPSLQAQNMTEKDAVAARIEQRFLNELETLLKAARDAQFPEEEVRSITVQREGKTINAFEYLEQAKRQQARKESRRVVLRDRYLTVQDIMGELKSQESGKLDSLREELVFIGAEEK